MLARVGSFQLSLVLIAKAVATKYLKKAGFCQSGATNQLY